MKTILVLILIVCSFTVKAQINYDFKSYRIGQSVQRTYKFRDYSVTNLHFAFISKMTEFKSKYVEVQAHRWFGNYSFMLAYVKDKKLGKWTYLSVMFERKETKKPVLLYF